MKLTLTRQDFTDKSTIGIMTIDDTEQVYTLEDCDRHLESGGQKIDGKTAIPRGTYKVTIDKSDRFGRMMPHVLDVPDFKGIRIHIGNTDANTEGCILVGLSKGEDVLYNSTSAFVNVFTLLSEAIDKGEEVTLEVV